MISFSLELSFLIMRSVHATLSSKRSCFHGSLVLFSALIAIDKRAPVSYEVFLANESRGTLLVEIFQQAKSLICKRNTTVAYFILSGVTVPFSFSSQMANQSRQQNTTLSLALFTPPECIAWLTVFGIEVVAMVTLNALEIIIYLKERSLRKRSLYLVINQAVADMFVGGYVILESWYLGDHCDFWAINSFPSAFFVLFISFYVFFPLASLLNLTAISLDRTLAVFRPFQHRLVKKKTFGVVIVAVWITAGLITTSIVVTFFNQLSASKESMHIYLSSFSIFLFCLLIILVSYSSIAVKIVCGNQPHHHGATNRERKLTKTLFIVTVVSLLLTLPYVIFQILYLVSVLLFKTISFRALSRLHLSVLSLLFGNSFVNPVLYTFRMPEFKRALFSFLGCRSQPQPARGFPLNEM